MLFSVSIFPQFHPIQFVLEIRFHRTHFASRFPHPVQKIRKNPPDFPMFTSIFPNLFRTQEGHGPGEWLGQHPDLGQRVGASHRGAPGG